VEELEKRLETVTASNAQKQLQLDTLHQAIDKLKRQVIARIYILAAL
jgi:hypothetical protein